MLKLSKHDGMCESSYCLYCERGCCRLIYTLTFFFSATLQRVAVFGSADKQRKKIRWCRRHTTMVREAAAQAFPHVQWRFSVLPTKLTFS